MDGRRKSFLQHRSKQLDISARNRNTTEKLMLDYEVSRMEAKLNQTQAKLTKEIKAISDELFRKAMLEDTDGEEDNNLILTEIKSAPPALDTSEEPPLSHRLSSRSAPETLQSKPDKTMQLNALPAKWMMKRHRPNVMHCNFNAWSSGCCCFPCLKPPNYTNIGFQVNFQASKPFDRFILSTQNAVRSRQRLLEELEMASVRRPKRTPADMCSLRESLLRKGMEEQRLRTMKFKPPDWCTNYGKPQKSIFKVARPAGVTHSLIGLWSKFEINTSLWNTDLIWGKSECHPPS